MQNKRFYFIAVFILLAVGAAAFLAGRLINSGVNPLSLFGPVDDGISILPAEELPTTPPEIEGLFVKRQDNIITVQGGGPNAEDPNGVEVGSPEHLSGGPQAEVVVTNQTMIYHDTIEPPARRPSGNDPRVLQQTVEQGKLDDLRDSQSLVMVWGRMSGDRIIAEVLLYSNPAYLQRP